MVPEEWTEVQLCRDVYHCTPSDLDRQDYGRVLRHLALLSAEARVRSFQAGGKSGGGGLSGIKEAQQRKARQRKATEEADGGE